MLFLVNSEAKLEKLGEPCIKDLGCVSRNTSEEGSPNFLLPHSLEEF